MNESEATAWNRTAEEWEQRIAKEMEQVARRAPLTGATVDSAMTIEELLGKEVRDAILDDVVP